MAGLKDINYTQPGNTGIPVQVSDLQQLWEAFDAFATSVDATTPRIISGFEDTSTGGLTGGIIAFNNKAYYLPNGTITPNSGRHLYVNSVENTQRVAENGQPFNFYSDRVVNVWSDGNQTDKGTYIGEATAANVKAWKGTYIPENGSVTNPVIADGAVTTSKIANAAVTTVKLFPSSVTTDKIASNAITGDKIYPNTITAADIALGAITEQCLADRAVTPAKVNFPLNAFSYTANDEMIIYAHVSVGLGSMITYPAISVFGGLEYYGAQMQQMNNDPEGLALQFSIRYPDSNTTTTLLGITMSGCMSGYQSISGGWPDPNLNVVAMSSHVQSNPTSSGFTITTTFEHVKQVFDREYGYQADYDLLVKVTQA